MTVFSTALAFLRLETKLRLQMERYETMLVSTDTHEKEMHDARVVRLRKQIEDHAVLRKAFDRRDAEVDKQVQSAISEGRLAQWR